MNKKFNGVCPKYGVKVNGYVEYVDSSSQEGDECSKRRVECTHKNNYGCTRNDCPYWVKMPTVI